MSNKRITDLSELTNPTTDDVFPVVDIATNTTTKVQLGNLPVPTSVTTALATKQDTLVSGTNIKTVNSTSLVGSGNVAVQETLVSGTNIKTINSTSLLGSGNITIAANPSGVAGAIQFSNGSAFASDAANLFWDDTNNRLGIGTNSPNQALQVVGGINGTGLYISNLNTIDRGDGVRYNFQAGSHILRFYTNSGTERLTILNDGSMGVGTSTPSARAHILGSGSTSATTSLLVQNSAGLASLQVTDDGSVFNYGKGSINTNNIFGRNAFQNNTTGVQNSSFGWESLFYNSTSGYNSAFGARALYTNTGVQNSAFGAYALYSTSSGAYNVAVGMSALELNSTGSSNSALGHSTSSGNFSGSVILGREATANGNNQFVVGSSTYNAGAIDSSAFTQDKRWKVKINGVDYYIALQTA